MSSLQNCSIFMQLKGHLLLHRSHSLIHCYHVLSRPPHPFREMLFVFEATGNWKSSKKVTHIQGRAAVHKDLIITSSDLKLCAQMTGESRQYYEKTVLPSPSVTALPSFTSCLSSLSFVK